MAIQKTVLVTGSAGFVGRHLVPKMEAAGYSVTGLDPLETGPASQRVPLKFEDWVARLGAERPCFDVVVHLAANIENVDQRMRGGVSAYQDTALDYRMAEYLESHPPRQCAVWMSSCAVDYSADPYAWVKLNGERLVGALCKQNIPVAILRPYSGYGADQTQEYPFPAILRRAMQREDPLVVWGSGKQVRDFVHVDDLTGAVIWAIEKAPRGIPVPVGTGIGTDFLTLARMMAEIIGYEPEVRPMPDRAESSPMRVADPTLAKKWGWGTKISLEEGIRRAVEERSRSSSGTLTPA